MRKKNDNRIDSYNVHDGQGVVLSLSFAAMFANKVIVNRNQGSDTELLCEEVSHAALVSAFGRGSARSRWPLDFFWSKEKTKKKMMKTSNASVHTQIAHGIHIHVSDSFSARPAHNFESSDVSTRMVVAIQGVFEKQMNSQVLDMKKQNEH